jgi:hypothetical protein
LKELQHLLQTGQLDKDFYWSQQGQRSGDHHSVSALASSPEAL